MQNKAHCVMFVHYAAARWLLFSEELSSLPKSR
jgi:hypothetical protein